MTIFGYTLVKTKELDKLVDASHGLCDHVWHNAGFINDDEELLSVQSSASDSETVRFHWNTFHILSATIKNFKRW